MAFRTEKTFDIYVGEIQLLSFDFDYHCGSDGPCHCRGIMASSIARQRRRDSGFAYHSGVFHSIFDSFNILHYDS